jgi:hypothetical protein
MAISAHYGLPGEGMKLATITVASWSVDQPAGAPALDPLDPYYFEQCYDAYAALQLDTESQPGQQAPIKPL